MKKITSIWILMSLVIGSACQNRSERAKGSAAVKPDDTYEYFVAPVGQQNPRNSARIIQSDSTKYFTHQNI